MAKPGSDEGQRTVSNPFFFTGWDGQFSCLIPKGDNLSVKGKGKFLDNP
jgi:hypothetical protein